ncbi:MAG: DUF2341 domain-containing protein, partial [Nanoarchaeota archaeon]|nr:DUF2341 domain-containing protein [Nanoarchaeota archaeon]
MEENNSTRNWKRMFIWISILVFSMLLFSQSVNAWWDGNWAIKQQINISTPSGVTPQNYSVEIKLNSTNVGSGFDWNNECSNNQTKIRFVDETDTNELNFWVKECDSITKDMTIWVKIDNNITTSGYMLNMYYSNTLASLKSDPINTFDFYFNMSGLTIESEGAGQDVSGNGVVQDSGRQFYTWGNSWKVISGFTSYPIKNDGSQILEMDLKISDCGEIAAIKFDTNNVQEDTNNYRWCGSQTNWGIVPDQTYSGSGNWEEVYSVLNDFTVTPTHIHLPIDDDADASGDVYFRDIKIRKYVSSEPTFSVLPEQTVNTSVISISPINNTITGNLLNTFTCNVAASNTTSLKNVSLYGNWGSGWHLNQTKNISGNINSSSFNITFENLSNTYDWNCLVYDVSGTSDWFDTNYSITIDKTPPNITINNPVGTINDVTPRINITFSENVNSWFNIDGGSNITLCSGCLSIDNYYLHLAEGSYMLNLYANDSYGNLKSSLNNSFTIDMNKNYYDNFDDNSSLNLPTNITWSNGNITYSGGGINYYNGIEIGYTSGNLNFFANQWGGSANAGEFDITCPGGDSACWFMTQNGTNISSINIQNGAALQDGASTVGFLLYSATDVHTRLSPSPHAQNGNNLLGVCYISGQWYYDDNNGCNEPFTPVSTDVLIANVTWATSISPIISGSLGGVESHIFKAINATKNITEIINVTWTELNTDANNNLSVQISVDGGNTYYNATNGQGIDNISQNNSLVYKITFSADGSKTFGISDINITWNDNNLISPIINLTYPSNNLKIISEGLINLSWIVYDDSVVLNCSIYFNGVLNQTKTCNSNVTTYVNLTLGKGDYNWSVNVIDSDNLTTNSSTYNFTIIKDHHSSIRKSISNIGTDLYQINIDVENKLNVSQDLTPIDFVNNGFNFGSFSPMYDWLNLTSGIYNGTILGWDLTTTPLSINNINYSITKNTDEYHLLDEFIVGL